MTDELDSTCNFCGKMIGSTSYDVLGRFCDGVLTLDVDPYAQEIYGDDREFWDCEGNRKESAMDI